ncbi:hypothetical protein PPROV_001067700 [Pycnococcus provasolii]|uniref:U3 small nucleolar ribonucleoprotein protein IMP3 n=1 Tax=Pycnococcus provasolii TaxID=41880 RepID=A0A830I1K9_9CHLO|nr:hypothetical protein PPROV_001067700 [Pycnococcus provasolii]
MRKLRHHEQRLLRHVDFSTYASEAGSKQGHSHREAAVLRRFHITNRNDYTRYNRVVGLVTKLSSMLRDLDRDSPARVEMTNALLDKLYAMGILTTRKSLVQCAKLSTASFVRRRLAVVMVRLKMAENLREATEFIEQGHVRIGPTVVSEPAYHVSRNEEDFVTWRDDSKIRRKVAKYNDRLDDAELL